jgi:hypothetical protein
MNRFGIGYGLLALTVAACSETPPVEPEQLVVPVFATVSETFQTHLNGDEETPPNNSRAQGQAVFFLNEDGTSLIYKLNVSNIQNVTQAHIHMGPKAVIGGVVVWLYPSAPPSVLIPGRSQGTLGSGVITDASVVGALAGQGLAGLLTQMRAGNTYVNVHTTQLPVGEVRGQID